MKKIICLLILAVLTISILSGCTVVIKICELNLTAVKNVVSFEVTFNNIEEYDEYDLKVVKADEVVYEHTYDIDVLSGEVELEYNTEYEVFVYVDDSRLLTSKKVSTQKNEITGVVFENRTFTYDGTKKAIYVGNLPQKATVIYRGNDKIQVGEYTVTAIVSAPDCEDLVIKAILTIEK